MKVLITGVVLLWAAGLAGQNGPFIVEDRSKATAGDDRRIERAR